MKAPAGNVLVQHPPEIDTGSWWRVTVAWIRAGQERRYGDTVHEAEICFEGGQRSTVPGFDLPFGGKPMERRVREIAKLLVCDFVEDDDPKATWASGRLKELSMIEEGPGYSIWRVKVVEPYTD